MRDLPVALRRYLLGLDAACAGLIVYQVWAAHVSGMGTSLSPLATTLFAILIFAGDHTLLQVRGATWQSFATTAQIIALLVLPPLPLLANLVAVAASQMLYVGVLPHKRMFNVAHSCMAVGLSGLGCSLLMRPDRALAGGILVALPAVSLLILIYYAVDVGLFLGVLALLERRPIARLWAENYRATLLPELASSTIGVIAAILWRYDPPTLALMALPTIALRSAFSAITRAEDRSAELARHKARLEAVLEASEGLRLQAHPADLLGSVACAARLIVGADSVTGYLRDGEDPTRLRRVLLHPPGTVDGGPPVFDVSAIAAPSPGPLPAVVGWFPGDPAAAQAAPTRLPRRGARRILSAALSAFPRLGTSPGVPLPPGSLHLLVAPDAGGGAAMLLLRGVAAAPGPQAVDTLAILASQADTALQNLALHERALAQAAEDDLTGLLNRRALGAHLEAEVARATEHGRPLALLMVDVDAFGVVNNTYGHAAGDAALREVAAVIRSATRAADVVARYGGDEFVVLLPETGVEEAIPVAERMRAAVACRTIAEGGSLFRLEISVGVAVLPLHAQRPADLLRAADEAAYAAKHAGKDRVSLPDAAAVLALDRDPEVLAARLVHANMATVAALAAAVDAKDPYTQGHSQRVGTYAAALAVTLGLDAPSVARIELAGHLHDIGKIGISDAILTKPGRLDDAEMAAIREHPAIGERVLERVPFLRDILPAVRWHHERWDGGGYPDGLVGAACPLDGSILAVADALDAMTSSRTYRVAPPLAEACRRLAEGRGSQFAPHVVDAFDRCIADGSLEIVPAPRPIPASWLPPPWPRTGPAPAIARTARVLPVSSRHRRPPTRSPRSPCAWPQCPARLGVASGRRGYMEATPRRTPQLRAPLGAGYRRTAA